MVLKWWATSQGSPTQIMERLRRLRVLLEPVLGHTAIRGPVCMKRKPYKDMALVRVWQESVGFTKPVCGLIAGLGRGIKPLYLNLRQYDHQQWSGEGTWESPQSVPETDFVLVLTRLAACLVYSRSVGMVMRVVPVSFSRPNPSALMMLGMDLNEPHRFQVQ